MRRRGRRRAACRARAAPKGPRGHGGCLAAEHALVVATRVEQRRRRRHCPERGACHGDRRERRPPQPVQQQASRRRRHQRALLRAEFRPEREERRQRPDCFQADSRAWLRRIRTRTGRAPARRAPSHDQERLRCSHAEIARARRERQRHPPGAYRARASRWPAQPPRRARLARGLLPSCLQPVEASSPGTRCVLPACDGAAA